MGETLPPPWISWVKTLQSIGSNGLHYANDPYDRQRYQQIIDLTAEMLSVQTGTEDLRAVKDLLLHDTGYITPKVDVRGVVFRERKILLVREIADYGRWTLPGGWADPNDLPSVAAEREVEEETGYQTKAVRLLAVYDRSHPRHQHEPLFLFHTYKLFFQCEIIGGKPRESSETGESGFFGIDEIPQDLSVSRVAKTQLLHFFSTQEDGSMRTDFD